MIFRVKELHVPTSHEPGQFVSRHDLRLKGDIAVPSSYSPTVMNGEEHDCDYIDEAEAIAGTTPAVVTLLMAGVPVDAKPVIDAVKAEARRLLFEEWEPTYQGDDKDKGKEFVAYLNGSGAARKVELQREVTDRMRGGS